jgi:F-type H+-transporting ATPase subunit delta
MTDRKLATRYARALLAALATGADQDLADQFLSALAQSLAANPELRGFLLDPANSAAAKKNVLNSLAASHGAPERLKTFLGMIVDNGRLASLPAIAERYHAESESGRGMVTATLTSAAPLSPEHKARAAQVLGKVTGKKVNLTVDVDPALLGGVVAQVGSMVYDGSLKTQLARLRSKMGEE